MILGRELHGWQDRVLPDRLSRDLIGRHAGIGVDALSRFRSYAAEPGRGAQRVHGRGIGSPMVQAADDAEAVAIRLQRLEHGLELEAATCRVRGPLAHDRAVWNIDETQAGARSGVLGESRRHGIQQRERERCACSAKEGPSGKMLLGDDHRQDSPLLAATAHARGVCSPVTSREPLNHSTAPDYRGSGSPFQ